MQVCAGKTILYISSLLAVPAFMSIEAAVQGLRPFWVDALAFRNAKEVSS